MKRKIIYACTIVIISIVSVIVWSHYQKRLYTEYEAISFEDCFYSVVEDIVKMKGVSFITINGQKIILSSGQNRNYKNEYISDNIFIGDSIAKKSGSDTIRVYRNADCLVFIHKGVIPKESAVTK